MSLEPFRDRVALVTGGSGGIGASLCRELAAHGAVVAIGYGANAGAAEALAAELSSAGAGVAIFGADLEDRRAPAELTARVAGETWRWRSSETAI